MDANKYQFKFLWDEPCEINGAMIYPVTMENYYSYMMSLQCLTLPKNRSKDIKVLKMNYFDYLFYLAEQSPENIVYISLLQLFLTSCFKNQSIRLIEFDNERYGFGVASNEEEEIVFTSDEFEDVKELILLQNETKLEYPELDEDLEKELERARRIKAQMQKSSPPADLEDIITALMIYTGMKPSEIKELTVRKFNRALVRITMLEDYRVYKGAEVSGMVEFKTPIPHWLSKQIEEEKDKDIKLTQEQLSNKLKDVASFTDLSKAQPSDV